MLLVVSACTHSITDSATSTMSDMIANGSAGHERAKKRDSSYARLPAMSGSQLMVHGSS